MLSLSPPPFPHNIHALFRCGVAMRFSTYPKSLDKHMWRCRQRSCSMTSVKAGSCFEQSKISIQSWLKIMLLWSKDYSTDKLAKELNFNQKTMTGCTKLFRQIITTNLQNNPISLGGLGLIVHLDSNCLGHNPDKKRNLNRTPIWVLGRRADSFKRHKLKL